MFASSGVYIGTPFGSRIQNEESAEIMRIQPGVAVWADLLSGLRRVRGPNPRSIGPAFAHARFEAGDSALRIMADDGGIAWDMTTYGTVRINAKATYQLYLGFFDGNPANLNPHPPVRAGRRYVELAGGADALLAHARDAYDRGDDRCSKLREGCFDNMPGVAPKSRRSRWPASASSSNVSHRLSKS